MFSQALRSARITVTVFEPSRRHLQRRAFARRGSYNDSKRQSLVIQQPEIEPGGGGDGKNSGVLFKAIGLFGLCLSTSLYMYFVMGVGSKSRRSIMEEEAPKEFPPASQPGWERDENRWAMDKDDQIHTDWSKQEESFKDDRWSQDNDSNSGAKWT
jgi:hypothetical protein